MTLPFTKMHGCGNDYIYVDCMHQKLADPQQLSQQLSNRHTGIGSDGLVLIMPSAVADFRMRIFNADGSEAEMCGNAARCIGKYVFEYGLTAKTCLTLETLSGIKQLQLMPENNKITQVRVNMGKATISHIKSLIGREYMFVNVGNPHAVCFVDDAEHTAVSEEGPQVEKAVEGGVNVEFVQVISPTEIRMRVWERGSGETMACGTGACAAAVATMEKSGVEQTITVHLNGGDLLIEKDPDGDIFMTGNAIEVFTGNIEV